MKVTRAINSPIDIQLADIPVSPFINNYSLSFDGIDDFVQTSASTSGDITLAGWVDCNGTYTAWQVYFPLSIRVSNTGVPNETLGRLYKQGANLWVGLQMYDQNGANFSTYTAQGVLLEGAGWTHLCWTFDNTTKQIYLYINGVAQTWTSYSGTITTPYLTNPARLYNSPLFMGAYNNAGSWPFNGNVDEVCLFDRIVTPTEIVTLSTAPTVDLTSLNPVTWYRNGDNGVYKSPQWLIPNNENKDKVSNYSMAFDGIDDRVQLSSDFVASGEFTLSFWMKPVAVTGNGNIFPIGTFPDNQNHVRLDQIGVIYLKVQAVLCLFNEGVVGGGANNLVLDVWQHMTFIRDSSNVITCYRNGSTFGGTATNSGTLTLNSFGRVIANTFGFGGGLDGIAFWNSDQTSNLATIYNSGTPTTLPSGAVAHYKMGEDATFSGGVWTVPDSVGSNDGTSVNMTIEDRVGNAPNSTSNAVSLNMDEVDRATDVPT